LLWGVCCNFKGSVLKLDFKIFLRCAFFWYGPKMLGGGSLGIKKNYFENEGWGESKERDFGAWGKINFFGNPLNGVLRLLIYVSLLHALSLVVRRRGLITKPYEHAFGVARISSRRVRFKSFVVKIWYLIPKNIPEEGSNPKPPLPLKTPSNGSNNRSKFSPSHFDMQSQLWIQFP